MRGGAFDFDPQRFLKEQTGEIVPLRNMPDEWRHGLKLLAERAVPFTASRERWDQVVSDAFRIASWHAAEALEAGWDAQNLFGFDPKQENGWVGLAVRLRGRRIVGIRAEHATIKGERGYIWHRPEMPADAPLLWNFRENPEDMR